MTNRWPPGTVKIHADCGGLVRWVEAVTTPGVGYHGECLHCHDDRIVVEDIIPVYPEDRDVNPPDILEANDYDDLAALDWDNDADWDTNQARLRAEVAGLG